MTFRNLLLGGAAIAALSAAAFAHSGATGVVKQRMEAMKSMGDAVKRIKPMMAGEAAPDADAIRDAARMIAAESGNAMTQKFPQGSMDHPTEARPRIWEERERFIALADQLEMAARGLERAADNGVQDDGHMMDSTSGMMGGQSGMMGGGMMTGDDGFPDGMTPERIGRMPVDHAFMMVTQTCSACHDRYRQEDD